MIDEQVPSSIARTVDGLYSSGDVPELGEGFTFRDPLVRVDTTPATLRMFERLRRLFPGTEVVKLRPLDRTRSANGTETSSYFMEVVYRRRSKGAGVRFCSHLTATTAEGVVVQLVEDWQAPFPVNASAAPSLHRLRALFGWMCGR